MKLNVTNKERRDIVKGVTVAEAKNLLQIFVAALGCLAKATITGATAISEVCAKVAAAIALHRGAHAVLGHN